MTCVCPQCEKPVPKWRRAFLGPFRSQQWRCENCNALLGWAKRSIWRDLVYFPAIVLFWYAITHDMATWRVLAAAYFVCLVVLPWLNQPAIVEYGRGACADCGYDIRGAEPNAEGQRLCPECGAMNVPKSRVVELSAEGGRS